MKKLIIIMLMVCCHVITHAQSGVAINTTNAIPDASSMLDVSSASKGILIPRITLAQRNSISLPATSLIIYQTDNTPGYYYNSGTPAFPIWTRLVTSADSYWAANGSHIYNLNGGYVGIGTGSFFPPLAPLHVSGGSVLFSKSFGAEGSPANPPATGTGRRMMWYVEKAAFRIGYVSGPNWDKDSIGNYSFATGYDTKSKGDFSFTSGNISSATGIYSTAMGWNNLASGQSSVSLGMYNTASGDFGSFTAGFNNIVSANAAIALGSSNTVSGSSSVGLGTSNTVSGSQSIAAGGSNTASGQYSVAMGNGNSATAQNAIALGNGSVASAPVSFAGNSGTASGNWSGAFGYATTAKAVGGFSIGYLNDDADNPSSSITDPSDRLFQIGNGYVSFGFPYRSNAFTVLRNGNVGIGVTSPSAPLEFNSGSMGKKITFYSAGLLNECGIGVQTQLMQLYTNLWTTDMAFGYGSSNSFTENIRFKGTGEVGIGTSSPSQKLDVIGTVKADGLRITTGATNGYVLTSDASGNATWQIAPGNIWQNNASGIHYNSGNVGIGTNAPGTPLDFGSALGNKIALWSNGTASRYGFGIQSGLLQMFSYSSTDDIVFGYGNSNSLTENVRFKGNGNVGIGNSDPVYKLDVSGRMRIRTSPGFLPGIWFNNSANSASPGFVGMATDDAVGFYANTASQWSLMTNTTTGNVGIKTSAPLAPLDIIGGNWDLTNTEGDLRIGWSTYRLKMGVAVGGGGAGAATIMQYGAVGGYNALQLGSQGNTVVYIMGNTANVGIGTNAPTQKLHVIGNILASGTITPSDIRYKKNIHLISSPIEKLRSIRGVTYQYKPSAFPEMGFTDAMQMGFIAQEVEKVFPELVVTDKNGYKAVDYPKITPVLVEAIKDQQQQIDDQNKKIESLNKRIEKLEKLLLKN